MNIGRIKMTRCVRSMNQCFKIVLPCILFVLLSLHVICAKEETGDKGKAKPKKPEEIHMTADKLTYDHKKQYARLINNVRITYQDTVMTSQKADFDGIKKIGHFTGGIKMWQPGNVLTGDKMDAYYAEKKAVITGHVRAVMENKKDEKKGESASKEKPDEQKGQGKAGKSEDEGPTIMTCEQIEFFWETQDGIARNNVKIWRKEKTAYSDVATYSHSAELITLTGNVRFERSNKDWMICPEAYLDMKTETFVARGGVEANMDMQKKEKKEEKPKPEEDRILSPILPLLKEEVFQNDIPPRYQIRREERTEKLKE